MFWPSLPHQFIWEKSSPYYGNYILNNQANYKVLIADFKLTIVMDVKWISIYKFTASCQPGSSSNPGKKIEHDGLFGENKNAGGKVLRNGNWPKFLREKINM